MKHSKSLIIVICVTVALAMCSVPALGASKTPAKVGGVTITKVADTSISLSWKKAARAKTYEVKYKIAGTKKWKTAKTKARTATINQLKPVTKYNIKIRAVNGKKKGKYSKTITQQTFATPGKINWNSIFAKNRTRGHITLSWDATTNASYYEIDAIALNGPSYGIQHSTETSYETVHQTKANTWYKYRIRAINSKTGNFPAIKGAWSDYYYTCTTSGDREIEGDKNSYETITYTMKGSIPFRVWDDDGLIPTGYIDKSDEYGPNFDVDSLYCQAVQFPADDDFELTELKGKTIKVGSTFNGKKIKDILFEQDVTEDGPTGENVVIFRYVDNSADNFTWR